MNNKVLIIGSGGREHAIAWKFLTSKEVDKVFVAPGNGACFSEAGLEAVPLTTIDALIDFAKQSGVDFTVVGPEQPLAEGIVDAFTKEGLRIVGPLQKAAMLETSKVFAKEVLDTLGIATASFQSFRSADAAKAHLKQADFPLVIKADGMAAGKGVYICQSHEEAIKAVDTTLGAHDSLIVERFLEGEELSFMAFCDGKSIVPMASSKDFKKAYDNDQGPNTGGMGALAPCPGYTNDTLDSIIPTILQPVVDFLQEQHGVTYTGFLYAGLMMVKGKPYVLEFNCRLGDPETQALMMLMESDLYTLCLDYFAQNLHQATLHWKKGNVTTLVLCEKGYPGSYQKGNVLPSLPPQSATSKVFQAGTSFDQKNAHLLTNGGRVLSVCAYADSGKAATELAYGMAETCLWPSAFYRKDIGACYHNT